MKQRAECRGEMRVGNARQHLDLVCRRVVVRDVGAVGAIWREEW